MTITNLPQFNGQVEAFERGIRDDDLVRFVRRLGLDVLTRVVQKTPVDTGRARGNWQVAHGGPTEGVVERLDPAGGETISSGARDLAGARPFVPVYVGNNLPYIEALEEGHSQQAPNGMVALTVAEIEAQFS